MKNYGTRNNWSWKPPADCKPNHRNKKPGKGTRRVKWTGKEFFAYDPRRGYEQPMGHILTKDGSETLCGAFGRGLISRQNMEVTNDKSYLQICYACLGAR